MISFQKQLKKKKVAILFFFVIKFNLATSQQTTISLKQGTIVGLKVFPETSKLPVYAFLGIPYAEAPIGNLRFAKTKPHNGWNRTLFARDFKPICPQIQPNVFEESNEGIQASGEFQRTNEDCLYLNVWTPESAFRYQNYPVLIIITGEDMSFDWKNNRPSGLDLAAEGVIVVTLQYRTNIFGWFGLQINEAPSNLALWDQNMALKWIRDNIERFGGDPKRVTLLGHGTTGATCAMIHMTNLFSKLIIMSGTIFSEYSFQTNNSSQNNKKFANFQSQKIVQNLACDSNDLTQILLCMKQKSLDDLLKAFENVYRNGNYTRSLGPSIDNFLTNPNEQFIPDDPRKSIRQSNNLKYPMIIGITNNEGSFMYNQWIDLAKQGYKVFKKFINNTIVSNLIEILGLNDVNGSEKQIRETINWKFLEQNTKTTTHLMNSLHKIISEIKFELPFFETIEILSSESRNDFVGNQSDMLLLNMHGNRVTSNLRVIKKRYTKGGGMEINDKKLYVYSFQQKDTIDMRGKTNLFGGASHSSDLPYLMGPSLFQQISRRRLTQTEEKFCRKMRQLFCEFIKTGNPTPGRLFDAWQPYTYKQKYIKLLSDSNNFLLKTSENSKEYNSEFYENLDKIENLLKPTIELSANLNNNNNSNYRRESLTFNPFLNIDETINNNVNNNNDNIELELNRNNYKSYYHNTNKNNINSDYYNYLTKIYSFWRILLPQIYRNLKEIDEEYRNSTLSTSSSLSILNGKSYDREGRLINNDGNTPKFKHAFFSMLVLVCLLLIVLLLCLYILKKNHKNLDTSFL